jgi:hypothetical protein
MPVGRFLLARTKKLLILGMVSKIKHEPLWPLPTAHCFAKPLASNPGLTGFHHLISAEAVQMRKGNLADELVKRLFGFADERFDVLQSVENIPSIRVVLYGEVRHAWGVFDVHLALVTAVDAEMALECLGNGFL